MKTQSLIVLASSAAAALATPTPGRGGRGGWNNKGNGCPDANTLEALFPSFEFTSTYEITATPDQVVNGTTPTGGLAGASGLYKIGLNADKNYLCWLITTDNFQGDYQSPAITATHIHEAAKGASGPPRIAFPNPIITKDDASKRVSVGCQQGPFRTGTNNANGVDNGRDFQVRQIQENPAGFFADVHSSLAVPGAVRGQLA